MLKICQICKGHGCEACDYEGVASEVTFTKKKIIRNTKLDYEQHQAKKEKEFNKIDKKNSREEF